MAKLAGVPIRSGIKGTIDYDRKAIPNAMAKVNKVADKALEATCKMLNGKIVTRTPRDTGKAQNHWFVSIGSQGSGRELTPGKHGKYPPATAVRARNNREIAGIKNGQLMFLYNTAGYIEALENGRSKQRPDGWIKMTLIEVYGKYEQYYENLYVGGVVRDKDGGTTSL